MREQEGRRRAGRLFVSFAPMLLAAGASISGCSKETLEHVGAIPTQYDLCVLVDHSGSTRKDLKFTETLTGIAAVYVTHISTGPTNSVAIMHGGTAPTELISDSKATKLELLRNEILEMAAEGEQHEGEQHEGEDGHQLEGAELTKQAEMPHGENEDDHTPVPPPPFGNLVSGEHHSAALHVPTLPDLHGRREGLEMGSPIVETLLSPALAWINGRPSTNNKVIVIVSDLIADAAVYKDGCRLSFKDPAGFSWGFRNGMQNVRLRCYMVNSETNNQLTAAWDKLGMDLRFFQPGKKVEKDDLNPLS